MFMLMQNNSLCGAGGSLLGKRAKGCCCVEMGGRSSSFAFCR